MFDTVSFFLHPYLLAAYKMAEAKARETLKQYFTEGKDSVEIVLGGKMGTGKSTLVNSIVGKRMAEEGNKAYTVTTKIVSYIY